MNPLEEHPHLFANGKFKMKFKLSDYENWKISRITGIRHQNVLLGDNNHPHIDIHPITLIARPIEDMTDEEWNECHSDYFHPKDRFKSLKYDAEHRTLLLDDFLYLLSIGVYPFDQQHFKDGTVIDSRTI